jgi:hypothetical protein
MQIALIVKCVSLCVFRLCVNVIKKPSNESLVPIIPIWKFCHCHVSL